MHKSKLISLIGTFSKDELKRFQDFVNSPYFNKNKTIIRFFNELINHYPDFNSERLSKEKIYARLFPAGKYNEQVIKNLISELLKLANEFLSAELNSLNRFENKMNLLKQLMSRKADAMYNNELKSFENELNDISELSERNFYYLFLLEELKISFHLMRNEQPLVFEKVLNAGEFLIMFFHLHLTKTLFNLNVNRQSFQVAYKTNLPEIFYENIAYENILKYMKDNNMKFSEILELYHYRVICNTKDTEDTVYRNFKDLLLKNINSLRRDEIYGLFIALETYCLGKINSGEGNFIEELFDIYNTEIQNDVYKFSEDSPVTFMKFRNTYLTSLKLKKLDWTENFIEKFKSDIIESDRNSVVKIANAQVLFEKGDYDKVLEMLSNLKPELLYHKIDIRNLILMSYFEKGFYDSVMTLIDSFRHFLSSNKSLSENFKTNNLRFINSLSSFILMKEKNQTDKLDELIHKLFPFQNDRRIEWLIQKINSIC